MKPIPLIVIILLVIGAWFSLSMQSRKVEYATQSELHKMEEMAFRAGVNCAINAHLNYQIDALLKDNQPSPSTMENEEWHRRARLVWEGTKPK